MSLEQPKILPIEQLVVVEAHYLRSLGFINSTIEQNGVNLFEAQHTKALKLEGLVRTDALIDVGLSRQMVCGVYLELNQPKTQKKIDDTQEKIRDIAVEKDNVLQGLLKNGHISLSDYSLAIDPIRRYLPSDKPIQKIPDQNTGGIDFMQERKRLEAAIAPLQLRGKKLIAVKELLNALTQDSEYPAKSLQLVVHPQLQANGERPKIAMTIYGLKPILATVGIEITTSGSPKYAAYRMGFKKEKPDEPLGKTEEDPKKGRILEKIENAQLPKKRESIVTGLLNHLSADDARESMDLITAVDPDVPFDVASSRFSVLLSMLRKDIGKWGLYIHSYNVGRRCKYYLSENPEPENRPKELRSGKSGRISRAHKPIVPEEPASDHEQSRREIEEKVRAVTVGIVKRSLVEEDEK